MLRITLSLLLCLFSVCSWAANGDIKAVSIDASGWSASITVEGVSAGGTYDFGLGTNNDPTNAKVKFTVVSLGFDDTGAATTITRTVYGTKQLRKPYPDEASNDETVSGSDLVIKVALSEHIYQKDNAGDGNSGTAPVVAIGAGWYTDTAADPDVASAACTTVTCPAITNNSTAAYPKVIGNKAWPGDERVTSSTLPLRAVAYHISAQQGKPVKSVKFWCTDGTHTTPNAYGSWVADRTFGDASTITEVVGNVNISSLDQGAITCYFSAYPWYGDSDSVMDTSDGVNTMPTPLYAPWNYVYDKGTYGTSAAVVDAAAGNDSTCAAVAEADFNGADDAATAAPCATIDKAALIIRNLNNSTYSRADAAGTIYLKTGAYAWTGASNTITISAQNAWTTIKPFPGLTKADVSITSQSGNKSFGEAGKIKLEDVTVNVATDPVSIWDSFDYLWFHNCTLTTNGTAPIYRVTVRYVTQSTIGACSKCLVPFSTATSSPALVRGCTIGSYADEVFIFTFLGNVRTTSLTGSSSIFINEGYSGVPASTHPIFAYNKIYNVNMTGGTVMALFGTIDLPIGGAVVQNIVEMAGSSSIPLFWVTADATTQTPVNNIMMWNNTLAGNRINRAYNSTGTAAKLRDFWSDYGNLWDNEAIKSDTFTTESGADGNRVGNWSVLYGVNRIGTVNVEVANIGGNGAFQPEFGGISSYNPSSLGGQPPSSSTNPASYPVYVNRLSYDGSSAGSGNGDYHLHVNSPAHNINKRAVLPFDLDGKRRRTEADDAGAYTRGLPKIF